jgi:endonuclease/exonuclease/phosphatase (EEP) superfamily protein YafD
MLYKKPLLSQILIYQGNNSRAALPSEFTACIWNFQKSQARLWREEFRKLSQISDLFLAQENRLSPNVLKEMEKTSLCWYGASGFLSLKGNYPTGVSTGSVVVPNKVVSKQGATESFIHIPKMMLATFFPLMNGEQLLVINVHAVNFTGLKSFQKNIAAIAELILNFEGPVLLGGDFNVWNTKRYETLHRMTSQIGLTETVFSPDNRSRFLGKPVDYVFTRQLNLISCETRQTAGSDHNPLIARFQIENSPISHARNMVKYR